MYEENYTNITNIDISSVVIQQMKDLYAESFKDMVCKIALLIKIVLEMDATLMDFPDNSFDIVMDKGTLDALMVWKLLKLIYLIYFPKKFSNKILLLYFYDFKIKSIKNEIWKYSALRVMRFQ